MNLFFGGVMVAVEVRFRVNPAAPVPVDHGHALYGAIKEAVPALGECPGLGIHPLRGRYLPGSGLILLDPRQACLRLRLPLEQVSSALKLAGHTLRIHTSHLQVGTADLQLLQACPALWARTVTRRFPDPGQQAATENLRAALEEAYPSARFSVRRPHTLRIHQKQILGVEWIQFPGLCGGRDSVIRSKGDRIL